MIKIDKLTVLFDTTKAVDLISLEFMPGKIYGIIGPNGAGKSTLLKACAGLINSFDGDVLFEQKTSETTENGKNRIVLTRRMRWNCYLI